MKRVLVAMSGGVDSSVAAYLLQQQGYECIGVTMKLYANEMVGLSKGHTCCSLDDVEDARNVAIRLGIPYYVFNFAADFEEKVIQKFARSYEQGLTPNPCIDCNRYLKFERLYRRARELGCDYIATGHYARIREANGRYELLTALDGSKDQSYMLCTMTQEQLAHTLFPLGELTKTQVRQIAGEQGLRNARKHDSQDICFVPDGDYMAFLERYTGQPAQRGNLLDLDGNVVGSHRGAAAYTIGQRRGLGLAMGEPVYVTGKSMEQNTVTVGPNAALFSRSLRAGDWNWIAEPPAESFRAEAKIRYRQQSQPVLVRPTETGAELTFDAPQRAISPGQAVVVYDGERVLGGGVILERMDD